jgi:hypothetical protein
MAKAVFQRAPSLKTRNNQCPIRDVGLQGYTGKREGISASAKVCYAF